MSEGIFAPGRMIALFALVIVLTLGLNAVADAQTPADVQYGSPTATSTDDFGVSPAAADSGDPADPGTTASGSGDVGSSEVLPSTGGPSLLFLAGSVALGTSGLLVLRRVVRR